MSSLSSLLNPAPSSTENVPSRAQQLEPLQLDGRDYRSEPYQSGHGNAQSPTHHTVTSPGLDVLATAASKTAPLMSPVQQQSPMAQDRLQSQPQNILGPDIEAELLPVPQTHPNSASQQHPSGTESQETLETDHDQPMPGYKEDFLRSLEPALTQPLPPQQKDPSIMSNAFSFDTMQQVYPRAVQSSYANAHTQYQPDVAEMQDTPM